MHPNHQNHTINNYNARAKRCCKLPHTNTHSTSARLPKNKHTHSYTHGAAPHIICKTFTTSSTFHHQYVPVLFTEYKQIHAIFLAAIQMTKSTGKSFFSSCIFANVNNSDPSIKWLFFAMNKNKITTEIRSEDAIYV